MGRIWPLPGHVSGPGRLFQPIDHIAIWKFLFDIILAQVTPPYRKKILGPEGGPYMALFWPRKGAGEVI